MFLLLNCNILHIFFVLFFSYLGTRKCLIGETCSFLQRLLAKKIFVMINLAILSLREKCLYSKLFLSAFSCIRTEYGVIRSISPYLVRMRENADQNNSENGHFLRPVWLLFFIYNWTAEVENQNS